MLRKGHILAIALVSISIVTVLGIEAQQELSIPAWVKNNALWWGQGDITDSDFISAINFLIENNVVNVPTSGEAHLQEYSQKLQSKIIKLEMENEELKKEIQRLKEENSESYPGYGYDQTEPQYNEVEINPNDYCYGNADCFVGTVSKIVDGDTIEVDGQSIRFALVNAPEIGSYGGSAAKNFVESVCPVGSTVLVDEDDGQTRGSYGRTIAIVYCNDLNYIINAAVIESGHAVIDTPYCSQSEFSYDYWALYGCAYEEPVYEPPAYEEPKYLENGCPVGYPYLWSDGFCYDIPEPVYEESAPSCDPSYPGVCIAPYPPDLNCGDIPYKNFKVVGSDPHGFDGDNDGIGCES